MAQRASPRERATGALLVFAALALLAAFVTRNGTFFDDEIASIRLMEAASDWRAVIVEANGSDVHPPLGYVIDFVLFGLLGSWKAVQCVAGLANAAALAAFVALAGRALPRRAWLVLCALAATDATAIMWGASLRWYAWFHPVFLLALAAVLWAPWRAVACAAAIAVAGVVLFHISYLALAAMPVLGLLWFARYARTLAPREAALCAALALAAAVLCLPQARVLLAVHLAGQGQQRGGLPLALIQSSITLIFGNAVFPLGIVPLAGALGQGLALLNFALTADPEERARWLPLFRAIALGLALLILSGLGYKPRNAVFLTLALLPLLATALAALPRHLGAPALLAVAALQITGLANVALHHDTAKRSFNTPYPELVARIGSYRRACPRLVVAHDDEVLGYLLPRTIPQSRPTGTATLRLERGDCVVLVSGSAFERLSPAVGRWRAALESPALSPERAEVFHPEPAVALAARWIGRTVEPWAARLELRRAAAPLALPVDARGAELSPARFNRD